MTTLDITTNSVIVKLTRTANDGPAGKLADAELHFTGGALAGLKLLGFGIWTARDGRPTVTFPARQYSADGRRRTFTLLRDVSGHAASDALRDLILQAYADTHGDNAKPTALEKA